MMRKQQGEASGQGRLLDHYCDKISTWIRKSRSKEQTTFNE
jgi:hypothetical protein